MLIPYTLAKVHNRALKGEFLTGFFNVINQFQDLFESFFQQQLQISSVHAGNLNEAGGIDTNGWKIAVGRAIIRQIVAKIKSKGGFNLKKLDETNDLVFSEDENVLIQSTYQCSTYTDEERDAEISKAVDKTQRELMGGILDHFFIFLAHQHGRLEPLLFEKMIAEFNEYTNAAFETPITRGSSHSRLQFFVNKVADRKDLPEIMKMNPLTYNFMHLTRMGYELQNNQRLFNSYSRETFRLKFIAYNAYINAQWAEFKTVFEQIFASEEFAGLPLNELMQGTIKGEEVNYEFSPVEFVDTVVKKFLDGLQPFQKREFMGTSKRALAMAQKEIRSESGVGIVDGLC